MLYNTDMEKILIADGLRVHVTKKRIKNAYLRVSAPDGGVRVSAPVRMSDAEILAFVRARRGWIEAHSAVSAGERAYQTGELLPLWGTLLPLTVTDSGRRGMCERDGGLLLCVAPDADESVRAGYYAAFLKRKLSEAMPEAITRCERIAGLQAAEWRTRDMRTRWGSCNVEARRVCLNVRLAEKPAECLDYVILHELCHLYVRGHGKAFWARMDGLYPDWKRVRRLLAGKESPCT